MLRRRRLWRQFLVGYNVILGTTPEGESIRLLNESVLNGTVVMILVTCIIASFATQKGAQEVALAEFAKMRAWIVKK